MHTLEAYVLYNYLKYYYVKSIDTNWVLYTVYCTYNKLRLLY